MSETQSNLLFDYKNLHVKTNAEQVTELCFLLKKVLLCLAKSKFEQENNKLCGLG